MRHLDSYLSPKSSIHRDKCNFQEMKSPVSQGVTKRDTSP